MSLEQKIEILNNEKIPQVYEAGQKSMVDESKIIEKTVSGTGFLNIDDVSEIPHDIEIQLASDTITDFSNTEVIVRSKNLWDKEYALDRNNWTFLNASYSSVAIYVGKDNYVTFSYKDKLQTGLGIYVAVMTENTTADAVTSWLYHSTASGLMSNVVTIKATEDYVYLRTNTQLDSLFSKFWEYIGNDLQIEIGTFASKYENYKKEVYTPSSDGKLIIKSISPVMNISTDKSDINLSTNYHKSYGMQTEYDRFWDALQQNGNLRFYNYLFAYGRYSDEIYNPKYPIILTNAVGVYINCNTINDTKVPINAEGAYLNQTFSGALIKVIRELIVNENTTYNNTFANCTKLQELNIIGIIGKNSFNVQYSTKLSKESITSIINALSSTTSGLSITLSATAVKNAFNIENLADDTTWGEDSEYYILRHSKDNWTISYV